MFYSATTYAFAEWVAVSCSIALHGPVGGEEWTLTTDLRTQASGALSLSYFPDFAALLFRTGYTTSPFMRGYVAEYARSANLWGRQDSNLRAPVMHLFPETNHQ